MFLQEVKSNLIDLFESKEIDFGLHQCNCFTTMGAGIAKEIKKRLPRVYQADLLTGKGNIDKLGNFSFAIFDKQIFFNLYGQYRYGRDKQYTDYDAVYTGLSAILEFLTKMEYTSGRIGIPKGMGCRNAGGKWEKVESIIKYVFEPTSFDIILADYD